MSYSPMSSSFILPIRKGPNPQVATHDSKPVLWTPPTDESDTKHSSQDWSSSSAPSAPLQCSVCHKNQGRYTCPKCESPYCSVACYQNHCNSDEACLGVESFYQERVSQVVQLELKEKQKDTQRMLARTYAQHQEQDEAEFSQVPSDVTEEELHNILAVLEGGDEQELARLLSSSRLKAAFERAIETGNLQDWFLEPWHPWWRTELSVETQEDSDGDEDVMEDGHRDRKTLDQRFLEAPSFQSLQPTGKTIPDLRFNLVSLVYGVAWTLRLYNGVENAQQVSLDSAATLVSASSVLAEDARFDTLEEALTTSTVESTKAGGECNTPWSVLTQDVALICHNRRLVGRALVEAIDILRRALSEVKKAGDKERASRLRRQRKKLEFYLAWSLEHSAMFAGLSGDIEAWTNTWKQSSDAPDELSSIILPEERVHASGTATASNIRRTKPVEQNEQPTLLKEVSVRRKATSEQH